MPRREGQPAVRERHVQQEQGGKHRPPDEGDQRQPVEDGGLERGAPSGPSRHGHPGDAGEVAADPRQRRRDQPRRTARTRGAPCHRQHDQQRQDVDERREPEPPRRRGPHARRLRIEERRRRDDGHVDAVAPARADEVVAQHRAGRALDLAPELGAAVDVVVVDATQAVARPDAGARGRAEWRDVLGAEPARLLDPPHAVVPALRRRLERQPELDVGAEVGPEPCQG